MTFCRHGHSCPPMPWDPGLCPGPWPHSLPPARSLLSIFAAQRPLGLSCPATCSSHLPRLPPPTQSALDKTTRDPHRPVQLASCAVSPHSCCSGHFRHWPPAVWTPSASPSVTPYSAVLLGHLGSPSVFFQGCFPSACPEIFGVPGVCRHSWIFSCYTAYPLPTLRMSILALVLVALSPVSACWTHIPNAYGQLFLNIM